MAIELTTQTVMNGIGLLLGSGAVGYHFKAAIRLEVLERLFEEKKTTITEVKALQESMDKRLTLVEAAIVSLNEVLPEIRKIPATLERLTTLTENQDKRVSRLEDNDDKA